MIKRNAESPDDVEVALYKWILQQHNAHNLISSEILGTKAKFFYEQITGQKDLFVLLINYYFNFLF